MACLAFCNRDYSINISGYSIIDSVVYYRIDVRLGLVQWYVKRRYREFEELAHALSSEYGISKAIPPKHFHIFGKPKLSEVFIKTRCEGLEQFITTMFNLFKNNLPKSLLEFLHINKYDIFHVLKSLSNSIIDSKNENIDISSACVSSLEAHSISSVLKLPRPNLEIYGFSFDISDILECISTIESLQIDGGSVLFSDSNLQKIRLDFDLTPFKSLTHLTLSKINVDLMTDASHLRNVLVSVTVHDCGLDTLAAFVLCDNIHKEEISGLDVKLWPKLTHADFSHNLLITLDTVLMMPNLKTLNLSYNQLCSITQAHRLSYLQDLNVSCNLLESAQFFIFGFENLKVLDISGNKLLSFEGLQNLQRLSNLNASFNQIVDLDSLKYITSLSMLDSLVLTGNPVCKIIDYRIKVLLKFGDFHRRILLDNEESTEKELDTVAVLHAISSAKTKS